MVYYRNVCLIIHIVTFLVANYQNMGIQGKYVNTKYVLSFIFFYVYPYLIICNCKRNYAYYFHIVPFIVTNYQIWYTRK